MTAIPTSDRPFSPLLRALREEGLARLAPKVPRVSLGMASCGLAAGARETWDALRAALAGRDTVACLVPTGCLGWCQKEPLVEVRLPGSPALVFGRVTAEAADQVAAWLAGGELPRAHLLGQYPAADRSDGQTQPTTPDPRFPAGEIPLIWDLPFYRGQLRWVTRNCGFVNPADLAEYVARGGYLALEKALARGPEWVVEQVTRAGLRGRGGAGFPTGAKWQAARRAPGEQKYVIANADEGDPGAYMDRGLLEGDPFSVIEGMTIGALAVGHCHEGFVYVRAEYPLAVERLETAIAEARKAGLLGENVLGSGFAFEVHVVRGAGAFVCGEETALLASIEGRPGEPRPRPPFPSEKGLWGRPTVINNVETWANVPLILMSGAQLYASVGSEGSKGTKVFSLVGDVSNTGLVEVPMGATLRHMVEVNGGGLSRGTRIKAVQTGGPSGGFLPASLLDLPVDYESLTGAGTIMGSGGLVVMGERTCMVDVARYFLSFTRAESCGKCVPCREGTHRMLQILERICAGGGRPDDVGLLEEWAWAVKDGSLCGLGQTAPNPVLSLLRYFGDELEQHVRDRFCPAGVCRELFRFGIVPETCTGCGACLRACPRGAIGGEPRQPHIIDQARCTLCGVCRDACPFEAIVVEPRSPADEGVNRNE
ncbi:MAG: NADH-ubiquinone oxidoreductase-F iron-sulfur binding region domain-containing protein [Bacillota bacterium]